MHRDVKPYIVNYCIPVKEQYETLKMSYEDLKKQVEMLLEDNKDNQTYKIKMEKGIDRSIFFEEKTGWTYIKYEVQIEQRIENKLDKFHFLDQDNLIEVMDLRKELLEFNKEILCMDTVGTSLNYLREFYNDVELDIEQNKIIEDQFCINRNQENIYRMNSSVRGYHEIKF